MLKSFFNLDLVWNNKFKEKKSRKIKIINKVVNKKLECLVDVNDRELYWKNAKFRLISEVKVIDSSPVDSKKVLFKKNFTVNSGVEKIIIDLSKYKNFSYKWNKININLFIELVVDDAIFFDTKITSKIQESLFVKPKVSSLWKAIIDPKDNFNLIDNIRAVPFDAMIIVFWLSIIGSIVVLVNTFVGFHDQFVNDAQTYFYSHYNSDGESSSPLFNSLAWSWALWAWIWFMIKTQLRRYMTFTFKQKKFLWDRIKKYKLRDIITGKSKVDLKNVELRVVACNMENGQYVRWSGSNRRTVSFSNPIRAISLFKEKIDLIPKNTDISDYIKWELSFEKMYKVLYPEQMISSTHGISVHWEVQLIHKKFIDQELIWDSKAFKYEYFLEW
jgi:hypothetical protein